MQTALLSFFVQVTLWWSDLRVLLLIKGVSPYYAFRKRNFCMKILRYISPVSSIVNAFGSLMEFSFGSGNWNRQTHLDLLAEHVFGKATRGEIYWECFVLSKAKALRHSVNLPVRRPPKKKRFFYGVAYHKSQGSSGFLAILRFHPEPDKVKTAFIFKNFKATLEDSWSTKPKTSQKHAQIIPNPTFLWGSVHVQSMTSETSLY